MLRDEPKNGCEGVQIILQCDWIRADIERAVIGYKKVETAFKLYELDCYWSRPKTKQGNSQEGLSPEKQLMAQTEQL